MDNGPGRRGCLPFDRFEFRRDNDGVRAKDPDPNRPMSRWNRPRRDEVPPPPNGLTLVREPGSQDEAPWWELTSGDINGRLPEQCTIVMKKLEREGTRSGRASTTERRPSSWET